MGRVIGAKNRDHDQRRMGLLDALRVRLALPDKPRPSYRELAAAAKVSQTTLRHHFGDRASLVRAVIIETATLGDPHLSWLAEPSGSFSVSMEEAAAYLVEGLSQPLVAQLHQIGLSEGAGQTSAGEAYVTALLDPIIEATQRRLQSHMDRGDMISADVRTAAFGLISPLLLAHFHQHPLGARRFQALDADRHREEHVRAFVRAYGI